MVAAALWDVLAKAANLAQLSGVHAVMLFIEAISLLRIPECLQERAELERCVRRLRALLRDWRPAIAGVREMEGLVRKALDDADGLVGSYDGSTLWRRLRIGRTMAGQLREVRDCVDSCCVLILVAHAYILTQSIIPPPSDPATSHRKNVETPAATDVETCAAADVHQTANDMVQTNDIDPGCEIMTAIVISNA